MLDLHNKSLEECVKLMDVYRAKGDQEACERIDRWIAEHFEKPVLTGSGSMTLKMPRR